MTYYSVQGWMRTRLDLNGAEKDVYAIIYGYSKDPGQWFEHNATFLAEMAGVSRRCIMKTLKTLTERGLLEKRERTIDGIKTICYRALGVPSGLDAQGVNSVHRGCELSSQGGVNSVHTDTLFKENTSLKTRNTKEENSVVMSVENVENDVQKRQQHGDPDVDPYIHMAERVIDRYEQTCTGLRRTRYLTRKRIKAVGELLRDGFSLEDIERGFQMAQASPFLRGEVSRFHAGIDWILEPQHLTDILEEKYVPREKPTGMTAEEIKKRDGYLAVVNRFSKGDAT